ICFGLLCHNPRKLTRLKTSEKRLDLTSTKCRFSIARSSTKSRDRRSLPSAIGYNFSHIQIACCIAATCTIQKIPPSQTKVETGFLRQILPLACNLKKTRFLKCDAARLLGTAECDVNIAYPDRL
ncbi:MAG: hypothetical protein ACRC62_38965, partial [Microcoleus sp.]